MYKVVFITASEQDGVVIAQELVKRKLAACVNLFPVRSIYTWKGKIEDDKEHLLIIKTKHILIDNLKKVVKEIHPYDNPECIVLSIEDGLPDYLKWIDESTL